MPCKALVTTSTFAEENNELLQFVKENKIEIVLNPYRRKISEEELLDLLLAHAPDALVAGVEPITRRVLVAAAPFLRVISRVGIGWDNIDHAAASEFNIKIFRTPDAVTSAVVELTVGLIFCLARHVAFHDRGIRQGKWVKKMGGLVSGKKVGVIGCGRVGKEVCKILKTIGCDVLSYDPCADSVWCKDNGIVIQNTLDEMFKVCDIITLHVSLPDNATPLINSRHFKIAKKNLLFVNVSRGTDVDESALFDALSNNRIAGAALDVFHEEPYCGPLSQLDNVILTPHVGSYAVECRKKMEQEAIVNMLKVVGVS